MKMIFQTRSGERRERNLKTLKEVHVGETVKVQKLTGEGPVKRRIMDMGITKGVDVFVTQSCSARRSGRSNRQRIRIILKKSRCRND